MTLISYNNYYETLTSDVNDYTNQLKIKNKLIQESETIYKSLKDDFEAKIKASFKVFYTTFFNKLGNHLFLKDISKGVFLDDVYIDMLDIVDEGGKAVFYELISEEFQSFLKVSFDIYEKSINNSIFKEFSNIEKTRRNKYHIINTIVEGLVSSSVDSIVGYQRNFKRHKTKSFFGDLQFHKHNLDLVIPDELLKGSIRELLKADLINASVNYNSSLDKEIKDMESQKNNTIVILNMIDKLSKKLN